MVFVIPLIEYKECPSANAFYTFGVSAMIAGTLFIPLVYTTVKDLGWLRWESICFAGLFLLLIIGGFCSVRNAPRHAQKVLTKRIAADFEYGRYIAHKYPKYKPLVKSLQPLYSEYDSRPITDFYQKERVPLWRRVLGVILVAALCYYILYVRKS